MNTREHVSADDLEAAIEWLEEGYEGEDETLASLLRVAAKLRAELDRRKSRAAVFRIMRETGCTFGQARAKLAEVRQTP